jgi:hypothetical protein
MSSTLTTARTALDGCGVVSTGGEAVAMTSVIIGCL